jgi:hypothetical protein
MINELGLSCIYTKKPHKKTPCIAILNKQNCHLFYKNREEEGRTSLACEVGYQWGRGGCGQMV